MRDHRSCSREATYDPRGLVCRVSCHVSVITHLFQLHFITPRPFPLPFPLLLGSQILLFSPSASGFQVLPVLIIGAPFISLSLSRNWAARSNSRPRAASS